MTMMTTTTARMLSDIAAAGLGKKAGTMTTTTEDGTTTAAATNGETWVEVTAATGEPAGVVGSITPAPERELINAHATVGGRDLRRIVAGIVPATDTESSRYALGGTLVEVAEGATLIVVGTDGRRMHIGHIQPSAIHGQAAPIVPAAQWRALDAALRAAVRRLCGAAGRRLDAVIDAGTVRIKTGTYKPTGGEVVTVAWKGDGIVVQATAVAVAGRFPRWRDVLPEGGTRRTLDGWDIAAALAEYRPVYRAAEKAARAAWKADREEKKRQRRYCGGDFSHPVGIDCRPDGMTGCGAAWESAVPAAPVPVRLDHRYFADALAGADAWAARMVEVIGTDDISAVTIQTGECGPRFVAVIMPLASC